MEKLSRRTFLQSSLGSLLAVTLVDSLCRVDAFAGSIRPVAHKWALDIEQVTKALRHGEVKQTEWQHHIETLTAKIDLKDLLRAIDYDQLAKAAVFPEDHESAEELDFSHLKGLPKELSYIPFFYAMEKGISIVPHGHRNMASMHMMLKGNAQGWQYDRVSDDKDHAIIRPTSDRLMKPGDASTASDDRNNIHWFRAVGEPVFMFNIGVFRIREKEDFNGRDYIDPSNGEKLSDGTIRAKKIDKDAAYKLYGRS